MKDEIRKNLTGVLHAADGMIPLCSATLEKRNLGI